MTEAAVFSFAELTEDIALENDAAITCWSADILMLLDNFAMPGLEENEGVIKDALEKDLPDLPPFLTSLSGYAGLDPFESKVLMICMLAQIDSEIVQIAREIQGIEDGFSPITIALLLALFEDGTHSHFVADAPLSKYGLLTVSGDVLFEARVEIDAAVLGYLMTGNLYEPSFSGLIQPLSSRGQFCKTHGEVLDKAIDILKSGTTVLQLVGRDRQTVLDIAATAAKKISWSAALVSVLSLPSAPQDLADFTRRWRRFAVLQKQLLVIDATTLTALDKDFAPVSHHLRHFIDHSRCTVILLVKEPLNFEFSSSSTLRIWAPERRELEAFWLSALYYTRCRLMTEGLDDGASIEIDDAEDRRLAAELAASFAFSPSDITTTVSDFQARLINQKEVTQESGLLSPEQWRKEWWDAARHTAQPDFGGLARFVPAQADFSTLVTDSHTENILQQIIAQFKARAVVREKWGLEPAFQRGNGITVLLAGESGTGKSLTAEVIANALFLDLYQIDLSQLVSKYIGETQKNLSRIFEAAEKGGAVLLFDEADALFSKRTDVKDARDRHANMEVGFLLQRMEEYSGIAILTTNLKENLDDAFLRRLQFVVDYAFPNTTLRARLWQTLLPKPALEDNSLPNPETLAKLTLSGAQIRNVIRRAVYKAASGNGELDLESLLSATQAEMEKSDRALTKRDLRELLAC
ncbi:MAG: ATP-binding protein [Sneathiellales bacterium]|nr:ATP-binding protein [Sneathiellales bacterium]